MRFRGRTCCAGVLVAVGLLLSGCPGGGVQFSSGVNQTDGFRFDFQGEEARRADGGEIDREVTSIVVDHRFGEVSVSATEDEPTWTCGCLLREPEDGGNPVGYWALLRDPDGHNVELSFGQEVAAAVEQARRRRANGGDTHAPHVVPSV